MYLIDTNIVSELRKIRPHGAVVAWLETVDDEDIHLSLVGWARFLCPRGNNWPREAKGASKQ